MQRAPDDDSVAVVGNVPREARPCLSLAETLSEGSQVTGSMAAAVVNELLGDFDLF